MARRQASQTIFVQPSCRPTPLLEIVLNLLAEGKLVRSVLDLRIAIMIYVAPP